MKRLLLITILVPSLAFAQKKHNILIDGGVFSYSAHSSNLQDHSKSYTTPTGSVIYSFASNGKFGVGIGAEFGKIPKVSSETTTQYDGTISPVLDFRYFFTSGKKSVIFPLFQIGYNFYNDFSSYKSESFLITNETSPIVQFAVGAGYSFSIFPKGGGPFIQAKFEDQLYKNTTVTTISNTKSTEDLNFSLSGISATIGFRF